MINLILTMFSAFVLYFDGMTAVFAQDASGKSVVEFFIHSFLCVFLLKLARENFIR